MRSYTSPNFVATVQHTLAAQRDFRKKMGGGELVHNFHVPTAALKYWIDLHQPVPPERLTEEILQ